MYTPRKYTLHYLTVKQGKWVKASKKVIGKAQQVKAVQKIKASNTRVLLRVKGW